MSCALNLADAGKFAVTLPRSATEIRELFAAQAAVLDEVTTPVLVHFDLWDGNILVESNSAGRRIGALIDAERAFWGDPLAEFVCSPISSRIRRSCMATGPLGAWLPSTSRRRFSLYRAYLYLIMWVEAVPRQYSQKRRDWLFNVVFQPMAATFGEWSPHHQSGQPMGNLPSG